MVQIQVGVSEHLIDRKNGVYLLAGVEVKIELIEWHWKIIFMNTLTIPLADHDPQQMR